MNMQFPHMFLYVVSFFQVEKVFGTFFTIFVPASSRANYYPSSFLFVKGFYLFSRPNQHIQIVFTRIVFINLLSRGPGPRHTFFLIETIQCWYPIRFSIVPQYHFSCAFLVKIQLISAFLLRHQVKTVRLFRELVRPLTSSDNKVNVSDI